MIKKIKQAVETVVQKTKAPLHIEFNVTDYCNLNCKCCSHYSPLAPEEYQGLDSLEEDMRHISGIKNAEMIEGVYLIGGETLLYPELKQAMRMARKYFPWAKISIFTNGLLIPKMDDEFWETCRQEDCVIALTRYPIKFDFDKVEATVREKGVKLEVFGDRGDDNSFFRLPLDPEKKQNPRLAHFRCISYGCITIDHGKIFPCSQAACVGHLNRKFGTDFKWEKGDYIPVKDLKDAHELKLLRGKPIPFCGYCMHKEVIPHATSLREKKEWVGSDN